jgi:hypothetical protein
MQQVRGVLTVVVTAAVFLAVPVFAVGVLGASGTPEAVAIAPGDVPTTFKQAPARPAAPTPSRQAGEVPAEVLAEEWVATGGGSGPGGSPKG